MDLSTPFKIDILLKVKNFIIETNNLLRPNTYGSFKDLFSIINDAKHYVSVDYKTEKLICSYDINLDTEFEVEILDNIDIYESRKKLYFRFLTVTLKESLESLISISNDLKKKEFKEQLKEDLWLDFLSLESNGFFEKESILRKKNNSEENPYKRPLSEEESSLFKTIFENYFTEWDSQVGKYFKLLDNINYIFKYYSVSLISRPIHQEQEEIVPKDSFSNLIKFENTLSKIIDILIPNVTNLDREYIENKIEIVTDLQRELSNMNIFKYLELCLFQYDTKQLNSFIIRFETSLVKVIDKWKIYYNPQTFETSQDKITLYRSEKLKFAIFRVDGMLNNTLTEILNFKELYLNNSNSDTITPKINETPNPSKEDNLSAVQKLLFIRLMQGENLFPKHNTRLSETEKQEFEYLAPLIGSNYQELKSAKSKVEEILSKSLTEGQKVAKVNDLNNVKSKFEKIIQVIEQLKLDIEKI